MFWPCETRTSTCRNLATISSGLYRFLAITVLLDVRDIPQVGPLQWGWIRGIARHRARAWSNASTQKEKSMKVEIAVAPIFEDRLFVDTVTLLEHLALTWQEDTDETAMISALQTALCLARDLEGNAGETIRTIRRTHNINWNATPERLFLKCVLGALIRKGLPKSELLAK